MSFQLIGVRLGWIVSSDGVVRERVKAFVATTSLQKGAEKVSKLSVLRGAQTRLPDDEAQAAPTRDVLAEVAAERERQNQKWGEQNHLDGTGPYVRWFGLLNCRAIDEAEWIEHRAKHHTNEAAARGDVTWRDILFEEVAEAFAARSVEDLRAELVQVAAAATQWVEAIDRRGH